MGTLRITLLPLEGVWEHWASLMMVSISQGSCANNDEKGQDGFRVGGHMIGPDDEGFTGVKLPRG